MKLSRRIVFPISLGLLLWIVVPQAWALNPAKSIQDYRYEVWEEQEGLPHYSINSIAQDTRGYLWLATYYGLVRFDGETFVVFDRQNTPELKADRICCLARDEQGAMWIGTGAGLLSYSDGAFKVVTAPGLTGASVRSLYVSPEGEVWAGTAGSGAFALRDGRFQHFGLEGQTVRSFLRDSHGDLWIGTNTGLFRHQGGRFERYGKKDGLPDDRALSLLEDKDGTIFVGTNTGLAWFRNGNPNGITEEPRGSTFHFTIAARRAATPVEHARRTKPPPPDLTSARILLAEDNRINQKVAVSLLRKQGCSVDVVSNGLEALARITSQSYDVVLMDIQMPEMDGLTAAATIRQREQGTGRRLPIVALTAHVKEGDERRCISASMDDYLRKPIDPCQMAKVIGRVLKKHSV